MQPALKVKYTRQPFINDVDKANAVIDAARKAVAQPDTYHLGELDRAIKDAEGQPNKIVCAWCGYIKQDGCEPISHGICESCAVKIRGERR
jgi:hypothetical protein